MTVQNKNIVLVMGPPNTGKSSSLRNLPQSSMAYLNCDLKETPFRNRFAANIEVADANDALAYIADIEAEPAISGGVLDTLTFLMQMYERQYVAPLAGTKRGQSAWGDYGNFYRSFVHAIKSGTKDYAILAHEHTEYNEEKLRNETAVPVKGAVGRVGVEADFTTILSCKQMLIKTLEKYPNALLNITDEEREDGVKYVFQTRISKDSAGEKMRSAMGLWNRDELYIDNDLQLVFNRLKEFYS